MMQDNGIKIAGRSHHCRVKPGGSREGPSQEVSSSTFLQKRVNSTLEGKEVKCPGPHTTGMVATQAPSRRLENERSVPMRAVNRNLLTIQRRDKELATWSAHRADSPGLRLDFCNWSKCLMPYAACAQCFNDGQEFGQARLGLRSRRKKTWRKRFAVLSHRGSGCFRQEELSYWLNSFHSASSTKGGRLTPLVLGEEVRFHGHGGGWGGGELWSSCIQPTARMQQGLRCFTMRKRRTHR
ncbi:unnamed protein product [Symbiodinium sp. CCMP2592]|nr:unnamed protein product [Symbiodinium sp. CCMP2592]